MEKKRRLSLLPRLMIGIGLGIFIGSIGQIFGVNEAAPFVYFVRFVATLTSLFSTFLNFVIPLLIVAFVATGLAELGKKANKLFSITLGLSYLSTIVAGFIAFFLGQAFLPSLISRVSGDVGMHC